MKGSWSGVEFRRRGFKGREIELGVWGGEWRGRRGVFLRRIR